MSVCQSSIKGTRLRNVDVTLGCLSCCGWQHEIKFPFSHQIGSMKTFCLLYLNSTNTTSSLALPVLTWQNMAICSVYYISPSLINASSTTSARVLCRRAPAEATKVACGRNNCHIHIFRLICLGFYDICDF